MVGTAAWSQLLDVDADTWATDSTATSPNISTWARPRPPHDRPRARAAASASSRRSAGCTAREPRRLRGPPGQPHGPRADDGPGVWGPHGIRCQRRRPDMIATPRVMPPTPTRGRSRRCGQGDGAPLAVSGLPRRSPVRWCSSSRTSRLHHRPDDRRQAASAPPSPTSAGHRRHAVVGSQKIPATSLDNRTICSIDWLSTSPVDTAGGYRGDLVRGRTEAGWRSQASRRRRACSSGVVSECGARAGSTPTPHRLPHLFDA